MRIILEIVEDDGTRERLETFTVEAVLEQHPEASAEQVSALRAALDKGALLARGASALFAVYVMHTPGARVVPDPLGGVELRLVLAPELVARLDALALAMAAEGADGQKLTRDDALRAALASGLEAIERHRRRRATRGER